MRASVWLNLVAAAFIADGFEQFLALSKLEQVQTMKHTRAESYMAQETPQQSGESWTGQ